ncbi:MAG TPA: hypothetical protein V6C76_02920 [Drouetiella sp.]
MTDFKLNQEVVHHHGKETAPQAIAQFQKELMGLHDKMTGDDATVSKSLAHYNFQKLDKEMHKSHNGAPAELDKNMHVSGVYKIDGKMQVVFTDDLYNKGDKQPHHAYTINEQTGKIDAVFDMKKTAKGANILERHKENGEPQTASLKTEKHGDTTVLTSADNKYTEYKTPDGRIIKVNGDKGPTIQNPKSGPTETYEQNPNGRYDHKVQNDKGQMETRGGQYDRPTVGEDGTITTRRAGIDFTTRQFANGNRAEYIDENTGKGTMIRITEPNGKHAQMEWDEYKTPKTVTFTGAELKQPYEMKRFSGDIYESPEGNHWKIDLDTTHGTINYEQVHFTSRGWVPNKAEQELNPNPGSKATEQTPSETRAPKQRDYHPTTRALASNDGTIDFADRTPDSI